MALIPVQPRLFKNYLLKVGSDNYETSVNNVTITPSSDVQTWKGGTPDAVFTDSTPSTWQVSLTYSQDWTTSNSLAIFLLNNEGQSKVIEFSPLGSGPKFTVTVIIVAGQIGGASGAYGEASVTLGVQGKPVFTPGTVTA